MSKSVSFKDKNFFSRADEIASSFPSTNRWEKFGARVGSYPLAAVSYLTGVNDESPARTQRIAQVATRVPEQIKSPPMPPRKGTRKKLSPAAARFAAIALAQQRKSKTSKSTRPRAAPRRGPPPRRGRGRGRGTQLAGSRATSGRQTRPPVQYGFTGKRGMVMNFRSGRTPGSVIISGSYRLGTMSTDTDGAAEIKTPEGIIHGQILGQPQNIFYTNPTVASIAWLFQRYRYKSRCRYVSRAGTGRDGSFAFVWIEDPYSILDTATTTFFDGVPFLAMSSLSNVYETNIYEKTTTGWSHPNKKDEFKYVSSFTYNGVQDITDDPGTVRSYTSGAWWVTAVSIPGDTDNIGDLWIDYELELTDLFSTPVTVEGPTLSCPECKHSFKFKLPPTSRRPLINRSKDDSKRISLLEDALNVDKKETRSLLGSSFKPTPSVHSDDEHFDEARVATPSSLRTVPLSLEHKVISRVKKSSSDK